MIDSLSSWTKPIMIPSFSRQISQNLGTIKHIRGNFIFKLTCIIYRETVAITICNRNSNQTQIVLWYNSSSSVCYKFRKHCVWLSPGHFSDYYFKNDIWLANVLILWLVIMHSRRYQKMIECKNRYVHSRLLVTKRTSVYFTRSCGETSVRLVNGVPGTLLTEHN